MGQQRESNTFSESNSSTMEIDTATKQLGAMSLQSDRQRHSQTPHDHYGYRDDGVHDGVHGANDYGVHGDHGDHSHTINHTSNHNSIHNSIHTSIDDNDNDNDNSDDNPISCHGDDAMDEDYNDINNNASAAMSEDAEDDAEDDEDYNDDESINSLEGFERHTSRTRALKFVAKAPESAADATPAANAELEGGSRSPLPPSAASSPMQPGGLSSGLSSGSSSHSRKQRKKIKKHKQSKAKKSKAASLPESGMQQSQQSQQSHSPPPWMDDSSMRSQHHMMDDSSMHSVSHHTSLTSPPPLTPLTPSTSTRYFADDSSIRSVSRRTTGQVILTGDSMRSTSLRTALREADGSVRSYAQGNSKHSRTDSMPSLASYSVASVSINTQHSASSSVRGINNADSGCGLRAAGRRGHHNGRSDDDGQLDSDRDDDCDDDCNGGQQGRDNRRSNTGDDDDDHNDDDDSDDSDDDDIELLGSRPPLTKRPMQFRIQPDPTLPPDMIDTMSAADDAYGDPNLLHRRLSLPGGLLMSAPFCGDDGPNSRGNDDGNAADHNMGDASMQRPLSRSQSHVQHRRHVRPYSFSFSTPPPPPLPPNIQYVSSPYASIEKNEVRPTYVPKTRSQEARWETSPKTKTTKPFSRAVPVSDLVPPRRYAEQQQPSPGRSSSDHPPSHPPRRSSGFMNPNQLSERRFK